MNTLVVIGVAGIIVVLMYNFLISKKNQVDTIFASVDTLLKKRYDLIPNVVASVDRYMVHEKKLLEEITALRSKATQGHLSNDEKVMIDTALNRSLGSLMVAVENYPELKASENMIHLQRVLTEVEEQISAARRAYNQSVNEYHNAIEMFPTNLLAGWMHLERRKLFEINEAQRENVDVQKLFNR